MDNLDLDLYEILKINKNANAKEIKKAYYKLVVIHHPDKGGKKEEFEKIQTAYDILSDENKRKIYDEQGMKGFSKENNERFNFDTSWMTDGHSTSDKIIEILKEVL